MGKEYIREFREKKPEKGLADLDRLAVRRYFETGNIYRAYAEVFGDENISNYDFQKQMENWLNLPRIKRYTRHWAANKLGNIRNRPEFVARSKQEPTFWGDKLEIGDKEVIQPL